MAYLRDFVDRLVRSFGGVFKLDHDPALPEAENVEQVITETALVAATLACIQPIPMGDIVVLAPLQAKMTLHIGRIKGFDISNERALDIVKEIIGVAWLHLGTQLLIGSVLKLTWVGSALLTFPLNYAATFALGTVAAHYFDAMRRGELPTAEVMREMFVEQFRIGKERGERLDRGDLERRAAELKKKVAEADPDLASSTRLRPKDGPPRPTERPASGSATGAAKGERPKIKIDLEPRAKTVGAAPDPQAAPAAASKGKTFGPAEVAPAPTASEPPRPASGKTIFAKDAPPPPSRAAEAEVAAMIEEQVRRCEEMVAGVRAAEAEAAPGPELERVRAMRAEYEHLLAQARTARDQFTEATLAFERDLAAKQRATPAAQPAPEAGGDLISRLERLARLREQGILSPDEFEQAKRQLLR